MADLSAFTGRLPWNSILPCLEQGAPPLQFEDVSVTVSPTDARRTGFGLLGQRSGACVNLLDHVSITVPRGKWFLLMGPSGCGKSTLLNAINNLVPISGGRALKFGVPISSWCRKWERGEGTRTGTVFQTPSLFHQFTVLENVCFGFECRDYVAPEQKCFAARELLAELRIEDLADRYPNELSGGQQQRVAIARALVTDPDLIIMDEPLSALDDASADVVCNLLVKRQKAGATIIMASHRLEGCIQTCSAKVVMEAGRICELDWCNGETAPVPGKQPCQTTHTGAAGPLSLQTAR